VVIGSVRGYRMYFLRLACCVFLPNQSWIICSYCVRPGISLEDRRGTPSAWLKRVCNIWFPPTPCSLSSTAVKSLALAALCISRTLFCASCSFFGCSTCFNAHDTESESDFLVPGVWTGSGGVSWRRREVMKSHITTKVLIQFWGF